MNFDDKDIFEQIDQSNYLQEIRNLDVKITSGWNFAQSQVVASFNSCSHMIFYGFQEHITELDLLIELSKPQLNVPVSIINEIFLPDWCNTKDQLVICLVKQGNSETIKHLFSNNKKDSSVFILEIGDNFTFANVKNLVGHWKLSDFAFSRSSIGYDLMVLLGLLNKIKLVSDLTNEVGEIDQLVSNSLAHLDITVPSSLNPAKRLAGQMVGRWIKIIGGGITKPVAQRWCEQINKTAKTLAFSEEIQYLRYHSLSGIYFPEKLIHQSMAIFLKSNINDDYIEVLIDKLKEELMCNGLGTDFYSLRGDTSFSQIVNSILFGDFVAYYLAIANQCDPNPIVSLEF